MPLLYRNVRPDVPDLTKDNGKLVCRDGAPSHRAEMQWMLTWSGDVDVTDMLPELYPDQSWVDSDLTLRATDINAALSSYFLAHGWPRGTYGGATFPETVDTYSTDFFRIGYFFANDLYNIYSGGALARRFDYSPNIRVFVEWDAANSFWRWVARVVSLTCRFYFVGADYTGSWTANPATYDPGSAPVLYEGTLSTTQLRAGNGVTLRFKSGGVAATSALANTAITVSAQHAT